jgi:hypothetical protein
MTSIGSWYVKMQREKEAREADFLHNKPRFISWCDRKAALGPLRFPWDGGNDSGACELHYERETGREEEDQEISRILEDQFYDLLDYGSWDGDFDAHGEAHYDPDTKAFEGTDNYSQDNAMAFPCQIRLAIPEGVPFDRLEIQSNENGTECRLVQRNGFRIPLHEEWEEKISSHLSKEIEEIKEFAKKDYMIPGHWTQWDIPREEFQPDPENAETLFYLLEEVELTVRETEQKHMYLPLNEEDDEG